MNTTLGTEARTFAAYLGSPAIPNEIAERYALAIESWRDAPTRFDRWLGRVAAAHPVLTALADAYARIARPYGDLRRRLTLILALLETHGATHSAYDSAAPAHPVVAWLRLGVSAAAWAIRTIVALILLAPMHAVASLTPTADGSR